ncbi:MAG: class I SAM-dependent methyltransferase [Candidatus Omnitrophica bacterium]|nr:class I SAM-dependent methyltransferase [Candidatus Omnitrophota bacterium]
MAMILKGPYTPTPAEDRMENAGNLKRAREYYYSKRPTNLCYLIRQRFLWMNEYCNDKGSVIELGSGAAFSKDFIANPSFKTTDYEKHPWIDEQVDALKTPFQDESIDVVIASHMIHHLATPALFFREIQRILKPGGFLLIQDIESGLLTRLLLRIMRHEGWNFNAAVFEENATCNDPRDPWSANCAIPHLLFSDPKAFENQFPAFRILKNELCECFIFALSGGVIAKTRTINLPEGVLDFLNRLDNLLIRLCPAVFAMGRRVAIQKIPQ